MPFFASSCSHVCRGTSAKPPDPTHRSKAALASVWSRRGLIDRLFTVIVWTSLGSMPGHPLVYKEFFTREACEQAGKQLRPTRETKSPSIFCFLFRNAGAREDKRPRRL